MKKFHLHWLMLLALSFVPLPSFAQDNTPLEVTADGTLEWLRDDKIFVARKNALAKQGDSSVAGETLTATYRENEGEGGGMQIWKVTAAQNVVLNSGQSQAFGDDAIYNLDDGLATLTGKNLKMISPDQTVTARDKFEYWVTDGKLNAIGQAKVVRPKPTGGTDILEADTISAIMEDNESGKRVLKTLEANGNVVITTPTEVITGKHGLYKAASNTADLTGGVKIVRGPNTLEGERAEVDLNTNTSKIFGNNQPSGRVRGVFYPKSENKPQTP